MAQGALQSVQHQLSFCYTLSLDEGKLQRHELDVVFTE